MSLTFMADQIAVMGNLAKDPSNMTSPYKGYFVAYNNGTTWVCKARKKTNALPVHLPAVHEYLNAHGPFYLRRTWMHTPTSHLPAMYEST